MKVHHKGYWGGAHGDDIVKYKMFDKEYNSIDAESIIKSDKAKDFYRMIISEYNRKIEPWRDYDDDYKMHPDYMALIPEGLIVVYQGYAQAEGQPTMLIEPRSYVHLLKSQYQSMYR